MFPAYLSTQDIGNKRWLTCCTSIPRAHTSVVIKTRLSPDRNWFMISSLSFWGMSPCIDETVKLLVLIFSLSQSTYHKCRVELSETLERIKQVSDPTLDAKLETIRITEHHRIKLRNQCNLLKICRWLEIVRNIEQWKTTEYRLSKTSTDFKDLTSFRIKLR